MTFFSKTPPLLRIIPCTAPASLLLASIIDSDSVFRFRLAGCRFSSKDTCTFTLILQMAKVSKYHQIIKIRFSTQNIKISAVSTPNFARISPFFCIFRDLPEYIGENASKCQKNAKILRTKFRKFSENQQKTFIFWYFGCILYFGILLDFCIFTMKILKICSQPRLSRVASIATDAVQLVAQHIPLSVSLFRK